VRRSYDWRGLQDAKKDVRLCAQFLMLHLIWGWISLSFIY
jgi:hypothetical protein